MGISKNDSSAALFEALNPTKGKDNPSARLIERRIDQSACGSDAKLSEKRNEHRQSYSDEIWSWCYTRLDSIYGCKVE